MSHLLVLNAVFFVPAVCGAAAVAWLGRRFLRTAAPPRDEGGGTAVAPDRPKAGPDDLARSA